MKYFRDRSHFLSCVYVNFTPLTKSRGLVESPEQQPAFIECVTSSRVFFFRPNSSTVYVFIIVKIFSQNSFLTPQIMNVVWIWFAGTYKSWFLDMKKWTQNRKRVENPRMEKHSFNSSQPQPFVTTNLFFHNESYLELSATKANGFYAS